MGFHNISEAGGIALALTGMTIVFVALSLVSLFIAALPRLLPFVNSIVPEIVHQHGSASLTASGISETMGDEIVAAIGYAVHMHRTDSRTIPLTEDADSRSASSVS